MRRAPSDVAQDLDPHPDARCSAEADQASASDLGFPNPCAR